MCQLFFMFSRSNNRDLNRFIMQHNKFEFKMFEKFSQIHFLMLMSMVNLHEWYILKLFEINIPKISAPIDWVSIKSNVGVFLIDNFITILYKCGENQATNYDSYKSSKICLKRARMVSEPQTYWHSISIKFSKIT